MKETCESLFGDFLYQCWPWPTTVSTGTCGHRARLAAWKAEAEAWRQADDCDPMVRGECIREARERRAATDAIEKEKA